MEVDDAEKEEKKRSFSAGNSDVFPEHHAPKKHNFRNHDQNLQDLFNYLDLANPALTSNHDIGILQAHLLNQSGYAAIMEFLFSRRGMDPILLRPIPEFQLQGKSKRTVFHKSK
jgi:hypothetical protein